ncbi:uncharacterized protein LOC111558578 isoform X2 [Felis catus]|uniref:uncharacterized protein LOC111558578 isoform X2 n=1 Tax=Felis catus TaxID=9685 RepID=UPI001D1A0CD0|nr:uncharacterized protein LOC111558578 isoform X2 [Felis catus]
MIQSSHHCLMTWLPPLLNCELLVGKTPLLIRAPDRCQLQCLLFGNTEQTFSTLSTEQVNKDLFTEIQTPRATKRLYMSSRQASSSFQNYCRDPGQCLPFTITVDQEHDRRRKMDRRDNGKTSKTGGEREWEIDMGKKERACLTPVGPANGLSLVVGVPPLFQRFTTSLPVFANQGNPKRAFVFMEKKKKKKKKVKSEMSLWHRLAPVGPLWRQRAPEQGDWLSQAPSPGTTRGISEPSRQSSGLCL